MTSPVPQRGSAALPIPRWTSSCCAVLAQQTTWAGPLARFLQPSETSTTATPAAVDSPRRALDGIIYGGSFPPRAAAHDSRIKALVAISPIPDLHAYLVGFVGREIAANPPPLTLEEVDQVPDQELAPGLRLNVKGSM